MLASGHLERFGHAPNREVIRLGPAAREDHFRRFAANKRGNGAPCVIDRRLCLLPVVMNTRRIAEKMLEGAHHGIGGRGIHRGRRIMIKVNAHVLSRMLAHGDLALTHSKIRARHVWGGHLYWPYPLTTRGLLSYPENVRGGYECGSVTKQCDNRRNRRCLPTKQLRWLLQQRRRPSVQRP